MTLREPDTSGVRASITDAAIGELAARIGAAAADGTALQIRGGGSKAFYGRPVQGEVLDTRACVGIVAYEPTELVITARAGTPLLEIEAALATHDQMLGFEPPHFSGGATLGGVVASGLSGPARPYHGAVRDFVLGVELLDGRGELLRFGGQVMKNVAGFDVSRLLAGSLGSLGVIVQASLRVLPSPRRKCTLEWQLPSTAARERMAALAQAPWPITGLSYDGDILRLRAAGSPEAVAHAVAQLAPDKVVEDGAHWPALRDLQLPFFEEDQRPLWRLSVPPDAPDPDDHGLVLQDWGGAQRWLHAQADDMSLRDYAAALGGHASCFSASDAPFATPAAPLRQLMQRVKLALDPQGIFNPGRLYDWL